MLSPSVTNSPSSSNIEQNLMLESWGLPETILQQYKKRGVISMFQWQYDCLTSEGVLTGSNLVFSAPTSAGKTMVAEIIAIQTVLERKKKVLIILPFVSVVREKMVYLQDLFKGTGVRVEGFMGSHAPPGGLKTVQIAIATIEKANSLINRLLEEGCLSEIGCVVVDELHLIGDPHRGYLLELLLTKLKYMSIKNKDCKVQVIGMSATLPNLYLLAKWLSAVLYKTDFRPIPLVEFLKVESDIIRTDNFLLERKIKPTVEIKNDPGDVIWLCLETILTGHSILIFCPTKNWCEALAVQISTEIMRIGRGTSEISASLRQRFNRDAMMEMIEQLKVCPAGLDKTLEKCICCGVSYHHAGLTLEERNIIEGNFRYCTLKVLVATSTLSSGVNLPARRVIIRSPTFRNQPIDVLAYKQMVGRAGRMGVDSAGESILICTKAEKNTGEKLVKSCLPPVTSCLGRSDISNSLKRAILEVIASGVVSNITEAQLYASCTLLAASLESGSESKNLSNPISDCLEYLEANDFIKSTEDCLAPTLLANACLSASLPPDQGIKLLKELHRARQCFVLDTELHVIYQVTPFSVSEQWGSQLDWLYILTLWENLTPSMRKVGELVGVDERFLVRAVRGTINYRSAGHLEKMVILRRFYTALALQDLVNEMPLSQVASKYQASKGMIQSLQQSASAFAGLVTQFCRRLGWATIELLVSQFCDRLQFGVHRELIDLLRCTSLDAARARALFNAGIESLTDLAGSDEILVEKALRKAVPFQSEKGESLKNQCRRFWVAGHSGLTEKEAASLLISEAREILKHELGLKIVEWSPKENCNNPSAPVKSLDSTVAVTPKVESQEVENVSSAVAATPKVESQEVENVSSAVAATPKVELQEVENVSSTVAATPKVESQEAENVSILRAKSIKNLVVDKTASISEEIVILQPYKSSNHSKMMKSNDSKQNLNSSQINCDMQGMHRRPCTLDKSKENKPKNAIEVEPMHELANTKHSSSFKHGLYGNTEHGSSLQNTDHILADSKPNLDILSSACDNETEKRRESYDMFDCMQYNDSVFNMINTRDLKTESSRRTMKEQICHSPNFLETSSCNDRQFNLINSSVPNFKPSKKTAEEVINDSPIFLEVSCCSDSKDSLSSSSLVETSIILETQYSQNSSEKEALVTADQKLNGSNSCGWQEKPAVQGKKSKKSSLFESSSLKIRGDESDSPSSVDTLQLKEKKLNCGNSPAPLEILNTSNCGKNDTPFSNRDSLDMFCVASNADIDYSISALKRCQSLEILNSDSGGDSILESSLLIYEESLKELKAYSSISSKKRKRPSSNSRLLKRKLELNSKEPESLILSLAADKVSSPDLFDDSFSACINSSSLSAESIGSKSNVSTDNSLFKQSLNLDTQLCQELDGKLSKTKSFKGTTVKRNKSNFISQTRIPVSQHISRQTRLSQKSSVKVSQVTRKSINKSTEKLLDDVFVNNTQEFSLIKNHPKRLRRSSRAISFQKATSASNSNKSFDPEKLLDDVFLADTQEFSLIKNHPRRLRRSSRTLSFQKPTVAINQLSINLKKSGPKTRSSTRKSKGSDNGDEVVENSQDISVSKPSRAPGFSFKKKSGPSSQKLITKKVMQKNSSTVYQLCKNNKINYTHLQRLLKNKSKLCFFMKFIKGVTKESKIGPKFMKKSSTNNKIAATNDKGSLIFTFTSDGEDSYHLDLNFNDECGIEILKEIFACPDYTVITVNVKQVYKIMHKFFNFDWKCGISDMAVAHWLLEPHSSDFSFDSMVKYYLLEKVSKNSLEDVKLLFRLNEILEKKLEEKNLFQLFRDKEMRCQIILAHLEIAGISFDRALAHQILSDTETEMDSIQGKIYELAGQKFNLNSPKEWKQIKKMLKVAELEPEESHPIVDLLSQWRKLSSLLSRNLNPLLLSSVNSSKLHGSCFTHTLTGRITMLEPNLQNIPRDFSAGKREFRLRSAFVPTKGNVLLSADYRQLELRILAHLSDDQFLKKALLSGDVFVNIASKWNHIPVKEVTDTMRQQTKQLIYGLIYGMGINTLSAELGVSVEKATEMSEEFKEAYPGVRNYIERVIEGCRQCEHIYTLSGRFRFLPNINHSNPGVKSQAERQAVNSTIQGSAADIAKAAMIKVDSMLCHFNGVESKVTSRLVLHLHDELLFEVSDEHLLQVAGIIESAMTSAVPLSVPLPVKVRSGNSWGSLQEIKCLS